MGMPRYHVHARNPELLHPNPESGIPQLPPCSLSLHVKLFLKLCNVLEGLLCFVKIFCICAKTTQQAGGAHLNRGRNKHSAQLFAVFFCVVGSAKTIFGVISIDLLTLLLHKTHDS
jgi:hypothetical protein